MVRGALCMNKLLATDLSFHAQLARTLGYASYGAAEIGECLALGQTIPSGDYEGWFDAWWHLAQQAFQRGNIAENTGATHYAAPYLAASNYARTAFFFLEDKPDKRIDEAMTFSKKAFKKALGLMTTQFESIEIPYENTTLPGYIYFSESYPNTKRPFIIDTGGGDNTLEHLTKGQAKTLYNQLTCQKKYLCFGPEDGKGGHCQPLARRQTMEAAMAWLGQQLENT